MTTNLNETAAASADATAPEATEDYRSLHPSALRDRIPAQGLREYWYPGVVASKVPAKKAVGKRILGTDVAFFRSKDGQVTALDAVCPHRGANLAQGACHFRGTVTCPYHGWTFDERGAAVAVLGEGPNSRIPTMPDAKARVYPTRTLKGVVWIWMGESEPADIREDVPPQFFDDEALVQHSVTVWNCNWRVAFENLLDAHVFYVHRDSVHLMMLDTSALMAMTKMGPRRPRPHVVNGRGLSYEPGQLAFLSAFAGRQDDIKDRPEPDPKTQFQDVYPSLDGAKWPLHTRRLRWHKVVDLVKNVRPKPVLEPMVTDPEWRDAHLPTTYQVDYRDHVYSRLTVPIDEKTSRIFYFHTTRPKTSLERTKDTLYFVLFQNWMMNYNFSGQDAKVIVNQSYDRPETFSATDVFPLTLRRFILENGRDFVLQRAAADQNHPPGTSQ